MASLPCIFAVLTLHASSTPAEAVRLPWPRPPGAPKAWPHHRRHIARAVVSPVVVWPVGKQYAEACKCSIMPSIAVKLQHGLLRQTRGSLPLESGASPKINFW